jgi:hypothetical protein
MADEKRYVSDLVAQGWEIAGFSSLHNGGQLVHTVLLRRQRQHKLVTIKKRLIIGGITIEEIDV